MFSPIITSFIDEYASKATTSCKTCQTWTSGSSYYECQHQLPCSVSLLIAHPSRHRTLTLCASPLPSVQPVRLRQEWMAPHFIRCGFYMVVASSAGRADHQEWIVPRSIARCGLDTIASSHQDPVCKPCADSPLHRPQRRYTAHCGRLRYPARYRSLVARCPLRSSAPLARKLVTPRSLRYRAPLLHVK
jgi:hypothetical protein